MEVKTTGPEGPDIHLAHDDGHQTIQYTAFVIDGSFADIDEPNVEHLRFDALSHEEMLFLVALSMRCDYDVVIRRDEETSGNEQE